MLILQLSDAWPKKYQQHARIEKTLYCTKMFLSLDVYLDLAWLPKHSGSSSSLSGMFLLALLRTMVTGVTSLFLAGQRDGNKRRETLTPHRPIRTRDT